MAAKSRCSACLLYTSDVYKRQLLDYYKKGMFPFDKLVKFYPFEEINQAFEESGSGKCIKAILRMDG